MKREYWRLMCHLQWKKECVWTLPNNKVSTLLDCLVLIPCMRYSWFTLQIFLLISSNFQDSSAGHQGDDGVSRKCQREIWKKPHVNNELQYYICKYKFNFREYHVRLISSVQGFSELTERYEAQKNKNNELFFQHQIKTYGA